jgi:hemoglobin
MDDTMLARYGGLPVIAKIVLDFYDRVLSSDRLKGYFADADMRRLVEHQAKFIASIMGGPASFTGEYLHEVHAHLSIDEPAFNEMMRLLEETLHDARFAAGDVEAIMAEMRARAPYVVTCPRA